MTDYEHIKKLFRDCFLAGCYWADEEGEARSQAELTATYKMQELITYLGNWFEGGRIEFEDGRIMIKN